jgi:hypothetical protein
LLTALATSGAQVPLAAQKSLLDRIAAEARLDKPARTAAVMVLKQVALGQEATIAPELTARVAAQPDALQDRSFGEPEVRAHAFRAMGATGLPEVADFIESLKPTDLREDSSRWIWQAAQIAAREIRFSAISDPQEKTRFLENTLSAEESAVVSWAVSQLCNSGSVESSAAIRQALARMYPANPGSEFRRCEVRMRIVRRDPDRAIALGSALTLKAAESEPLLTWWAIKELIAMRSPAARNELARFAADIEQILNFRTPGRLRMFRERIRQEVPAE